MSTSSAPLVTAEGLLEQAESDIDDILDALSENSDISTEALGEFYDDLIHRMTTFRAVL